jgi:hypothetical protein
LCVKGLLFAAFLHDAIAVAENNMMFEEPLPFLVEIKSKFTPVPPMKEMALAGTYGTRITAYVALTDPTKTTFNT